MGSRLLRSASGMKLSVLPEDCACAPAGASVAISAAASMPRQASVRLNPMKSLPHAGSYGPSGSRTLRHSPPLATPPAALVRAIAPSGILPDSDQSLDPASHRGERLDESVRRPRAGCFLRHPPDRRLRQEESVTCRRDAGDPAPA